MSAVESQDTVVDPTEESLSTSVSAQADPLDDAVVFDYAKQATIFKTALAKQGYTAEFEIMSREDMTGSQKEFLDKKCEWGTALLEITFWPIGPSRKMFWYPYPVFPDQLDGRKKLEAAWSAFDYAERHGYFGNRKRRKKSQRRKAK